jgi:esterase/lipase superfamily enzyme
VNRRELTVADVPVRVYGRWGRPLLVFPSEQGQPWDYEANGMIGAIESLLDASRVKIYCLSSFDSWSWADRAVPLEERARRHGHYERWVMEHVAPFIHRDNGGAAEIMVTGCSLGAYHAANFALKRADLFPLAICLSGVYDISRFGWGERGHATYFNNPMDYVSHLHGDHLEWLRGRLSLLLICGQGQWEDTTGALESTRRFAHLAAGKGLRVELDLWGFDIPHDWPSWRMQIAHHLPRFC